MYLREYGLLIGRPCVLLKWTVNDWQWDVPVDLYSVLHSTQLHIVVAFTTKTGFDTLFQGIHFFHLSWDYSLGFKTPQRTLTH